MNCPEVTGSGTVHDPLQIIDIRQLIRDLSETMTIIFSTHIMQEASAVSDQILIINHGKRIAFGTVAELEQKAMKQDVARLTVKAPRDQVQNALSGVRSAERVEFVKEKNGFVTFELRSKFGSGLWQEVDGIVKEAGWPLRAFGEHRLSLEDTFIELTRVSQSRN